MREVAHETAQELRSPIIPISTSPTSRGRSRTHQSAPGTRHAADFDDSEYQDPDAQAADLTDAFTMDSYRQHEQDAIAAAHNDASSSDEEDLDGEAIDDLDDDLMDKISSSPSIEDGVYNSSPNSTKTASASAHAWPRRVSSLPTTPRFRRQAAARFFNSQLQATPVSQQPISQPQQPRHLLLSRSGIPIRTQGIESKTDIEPSATVDTKPEPIKHQIDTVQLAQEEASFSNNQRQLLRRQQDNALD